jgi:hypothetical protein
VFLCCCLRLLLIRWWVSYFIANVLRYSGAENCDGNGGCDAHKKEFLGWREEIGWSHFDDDNEQVDAEEQQSECDPIEITYASDCTQKVRLEMSGERVTCLMRWLQSSREIAARIEKEERRQHQQQQQQPRVYLSSSSEGLDERLKLDAAEVPQPHAIMFRLRL